MISFDSMFASLHKQITIAKCLRVLPIVQYERDARISRYLSPLLAIEPKLLRYLSSIQDTV